MLTRSKAAAKAADDATATASAQQLAQTSRGSRASAAAADNEASMQDDRVTVDNPACIASESGASELLAAPSAPSSRIGRKRSADAAPAAAAQRAAAAPSLVSQHHPSGSNSSPVDERKKQRGESAQQDCDAVSVGFEQKDADTSAVSATLSNGHSSSADGMADVPSSLPLNNMEERKEGPSAAGSSACAASASVSDDESRAIAARAEANRIYATAGSLIPVALAVVETDSARHNTLYASSVDRSHFESVMIQARGCMQLRPAELISMAAVGRLFNTVVDLGASLSRVPANAASPAPLRDELLRLDALYTQLAAIVPHLNLSVDHSDLLIRSSFGSGALQLIPALTRHSSASNSISMFTSRGDPALVYFCLNPRTHVMCHQPFLRLFDFGLDPTHFNAADEKRTSALHIAREFARDHPPAVGVAAAADAAEPMADVPVADDRPIPSVLAAYAMHQQLAAASAETQRRVDLHAAFMHALLPAWLSHSVKVLSLLSSPSVLIPDLAVIVGRYLDLEGLPVEPVESVDEDGEENAESAE